MSRAAADCEVCGEFTRMPFECNGCGGVHCSTHQLPENHSCPSTDSGSDAWFTGPSSQESRAFVSETDSRPSESRDSGRANATADPSTGDSTTDRVLNGGRERAGRLVTRVVRGLRGML